MTRTEIISKIDSFKSNSDYEGLYHFCESIDGEANPQEKSICYKRAEKIKVLCLQKIDEIGD